MHWMDRTITGGSLISFGKPLRAIALLLAAGLVWLVFQITTAGPGSKVQPDADSSVTLVQQAEYIVSDSKTMPPADAGWQPATLPHRVSKPHGDALVGYWYKASVRLPDSAQAWSDAPTLWLYLPELVGGGAVYFNDSLVGSIPSADAATQVRLYRPHLMLLPPLALHAGVNRIVLHFAIREPLTSVGAMAVGPEQALRSKFDRLLFLVNTTAEISTAICLMAGITLLAFWLRRPQERLYGLFALCLLFWGTRTLLMRLPVVPMSNLIAWRVAYYFTTSGFIVLISIFMLNFSGASKPLFARFMVAYAIAGCVLFAAFGMPFRVVMDSLWLLGFLPCAMYCVLQLALFAVRQRSRASLAMGLAMLLALSLSMHDYAVQQGWFHLSDMYLMHLGIPVFLLVMAGVLSDRFLDSLQIVESVNERLALRIGEREQELARSYERLARLERVHGATEERQRIMQDMHDGVGSQLLTAMAIVERGSASRSDTLSLLQQCLDDMRLALDSLTPDDPDLLPALGSFRFRMQARLAEAGISLQWRNHDLPDLLELGARSGLQVLRILQEALANVVKHAHAANVTVDLHFSPQLLVIRVGDDGIGDNQAGNCVGQGLRNMHDRAGKIGATLRVQHLPAGTMLTLELPLKGAVASRATVTDRAA